MISYSIIQKSQLEGAHRLDAEYYQPEYLHLISKLKTQISKSLKDIAFITDGIHASIDYDKESNIKCFSAQSVNENYFNEVESHISEKQHRENLRTSLKEGDVLLSSVGTIGNAAIINQDLLPANADRHVAIIRLKDKTISPFYLSVFLNSKYGKFQSVRESTGNVQLNLFIDKIRNFIIPIFDSTKTNQINEQIKQGLNELENSKFLYSQAENLLLEELGLKDFEIEEDLSYIINLSKIKSSHRADAEYFQPKYEKLITKIRKQNVKSIEQLSVLVGHSTQSPYDETGDIAVLAQKHMKRNLAIDTSAFDNYTTEKLIKKSDKKFILKNGDLLISSAGEPGLTCVWTDEGKVIPGSFVTIVRFAGEVNPFYAGVFLNTIAGRLQFERDYTGSVQQYVYPAKIKEIAIPILSKLIQQKIADLVQKSHEARSKARELLEETKQKVEKLIAK